MSISAAYHASKPAERGKYIGGGDIAPILGRHPYRSATNVWMSKTGKPLPSFDDEAKNRMFWGTAFQNVIAARYDPEAVLLDEPRLDRTNEFFGNTPDFCNDKKKELIEVKTAGVRQLHRWDDTKYPLEYKLQTMWYLMQYPEAEYATIVALLGGQEFRTYPVYRDDELIGIMKDKANKFWVDHVLTDTPPDGWSTDSNYLDWKYPNETEISRDATDEEEYLIKKIGDYRGELKAMGGAKRNLESALLGTMGDAHIVTGEAGVALIRHYKARNATKWAELAKELLVGNPNADKLIEKYTSKSEARRELEVFVGG